MASLIGRLIFYEYEGFEPAIGVIAACSQESGKTVVMFLDGHKEETFSPRQLEEWLTLDCTNYNPSQWIQSVKNLLKRQGPMSRSAQQPAELVGRTVIFTYPKHAPAVGIISKATASAVVVRFTDNFIDTFTAEEIQLMLLPDSSVYAPRPWLSHMKALLRKQASTVSGKRHRTLAAVEGLVDPAEVDALLQQAEAEVKAAKKFKPEDDYRSLRVVAAKTVKDGETSVLVRWFQGGREWLPLACLSDPAQEEANRLPVSGHRVHELSFPEYAWITQVIRSARTNMSQKAKAFEPSTEELLLPEALPDYLVGTKAVAELPSWVPRIIGLERAPEAGAIIQISTKRKPADAFNFGHEGCQYCAYKLTENLEADGRYNPHLFDIFSDNPDRKNPAQHCRCSTVHEYVSRSGPAFRYSVRVNRMLDGQMTVMRGALKRGEVLDSTRL